MIPMEIVDHILSLLHSEQDYGTLDKCSVVFPGIVDRHLFSGVGFARDLVGKAISRDFGKPIWVPVIYPTRFSSILLDRPHLANYVRDVMISIPDEPEEFPVLLSDITPILPILPLVESIQLCVGDRLFWHALDPEFRTAFRNFIRLPSIKDVSLHNVDGFSLDAFHGCKNLQTLFLHGEFIEGEDVSTSFYPRLSSLSVDHLTPSTKLLSWMTGDTLNTLHLRARQESDVPKFLPLIEACSASLVNLEFYFFYLFGLSTTSFFPDLQLPLLDHITLHSPLTMERDVVHYSSPPSFIPFLSSIPNIPSLSPIRLTIHFEVRSNVSTNQTLCWDWSDVAAILVLPIFRHPIDLYIRPEDSRYLYDHSAMARAVSSLSKCPDAKKLLEDGKLIVITPTTMSTPSSSIFPSVR